MNTELSFSEDFIGSIKPRDYKCPCGKAYLSYAALFTHVKQKHQGKAPGKISKPATLHQKRGRPPIRLNIQKKDAQNQGAQNRGIEIQLMPVETEQERMQRQQRVDSSIGNIVGVLEQMPEQQLCKTHLNQIQVFSQMTVYLNTRIAPGTSAHGSICVADGFLQFAQQVCSKITWSQFQPFYLLFMLFLQFIIDVQNDKTIVREGSMDFFCEYVNDFIENHIRDMAEYYYLENVWIMQRENSVRVLHGFFCWCMAMRYVTYNVGLAERQVNSQNYEVQEVDGQEKSVQYRGTV